MAELGVAHARGRDRPRRAARQAGRARAATKRAAARPLRPARRPGDRRPPRAAPPHARPRAARRALRRPRAARRGAARRSTPASRCGSSAGHQRRPRRRRPALARGRRPPRPGGLPDDTIEVELAARPGRASAPGSRPGSRSTLEGEANDYVGKGLSGGVLAVRPPDGGALRRRGERDHRQRRPLRRDRGRAFFRGLAGERFAVRNSGALRRGRGRRRPRLRVHDRRPRRRARPDRPQLRRRDERRHRLGPRPRRPPRRCAPTPSSSTSSRSTGRGGARARGAGRPSTTAAPARASPRSCSSDWDEALGRVRRVIPREYARALERRDEPASRRRPSSGRWRHEHAADPTRHS